MVFGRLAASALAGFVSAAAAASSSIVFADDMNSKAENTAQILDDLANTITKEQGGTDDVSDLVFTKTWGVPWIDDWDAPASRGLTRRSSRIKRQIILVRHAQYQNEKGKVDDTARVLTPLGRKQSEDTGKYLAELFYGSGGACELIEPGIREPKYCFVSNMTRARQTADLLLGAFPSTKQNHKKNLVIDPLLKERFPCDPQPPYPRSADEHDCRRVEEAFTKYFYRPVTDEPTCDIIVCHANVIRYFLCRALQIPPEAWLRFSLPHCSLTSIVIGGSGHVKVNAVGSAGHLDPTMLTYHNV